MKTKEIPVFTAYVATNVVTGKKYVGITSVTVADRWRRHIAEARRRYRNGPMQWALRKHGQTAFEVVAAACSRSWADIYAVERVLIAQEGSRSPGGYNLTDGGQGVLGLRHSPESVRRQSELARGRRHTEETKRLIGKGARGRKHSPEATAAISAARKGKKLSAEHRLKLSEAKLGKKLPPRSVEHCERISSGLVRAHAQRRGGLYAY